MTSQRTFSISVKSILSSRCVIYIYIYIFWKKLKHIYSICIYIYMFFPHGNQELSLGPVQCKFGLCKTNASRLNSKIRAYTPYESMVMSMADRRKSLSILTSSSTGYICMDIIHTHMYIYIIIYMGVNYNSSLTWIKAIKGDNFPIKTMIPGFGRSEVVISYPSSFRPRGRAAAHLPWYHLPQSRWPWQWPAAAHNRRR